MALSGLGPWNQITPEFFTQAMQAGARLGLASREADVGQEDASDRLKLAYTQLASKEKEEAEARKIQLKQIDAANALKAQQASALAQYRAVTAAATAARIQDAADQLAERHRHNLVTEQKDTQKGDTQTTTEETPAVEAQPAIPQSTTGIWPFRTVHPAVAAVMAQPKRTVKHTVRLPALGQDEVQRRTKDGRIGIFNSKTKEFIRYAQPDLGGNSSTGSDDDQSE